MRNKKCDSIPDSEYTEFEKTLTWYTAEEIDVLVTFTVPGYDTLYLGNAMGLSCLINIGDNNKDGKDEIALSRDNVDFSGLGSCFIYTLCSNEWQPVKRISILETAAFSWETDTTPVFKDIPGFLEKHNGRWMYSDYVEQMRAENEDDLKMKKLVLHRCCDK